MRSAFAVTATALFAVGSVALTAPSYAQSFSQNFDTGVPAGWVVTNNSSPLGSTSWFQGNPLAFPAQSGPANSYVGANFNNTGNLGTISDWLITPVINNLQNGDTFSFFTRTTTPTPGFPVFPDRLELRLSLDGSSTNVGTTATSVGTFTTLLVSVNPNLTTTGYPADWTQYSVTLSGLAAPQNGRLAFRYFVTSAGLFGANSDYIGVDTVAYTSANDVIPEPGTLALVGLVGLPLLYRRRSRKNADLV